MTETIEEKKIEEVFNKYSHKDNGGEYMYYSHFLKAVMSICQQEIKDHNQQIIKLIDERLEKERIKANEYMFNTMSQFTVEALTELKQEVMKLGVEK